MKMFFRLVSILLLALSVSLVLSTQVFAGTGKGEKSGKSPKAKSQMGTSFRFDGSNLSGKFQNSPGTTAMVEDDKFIDDLLGARKNFTDRINKDRARN